MTRRVDPSLLDAFAEAAECNLATLGELLGIRSTSQSRIRRQKSICLDMLRALHPYRPEINWGSHHRPLCPRVQEMLDKAATPKELEDQLDTHVADLTRIFRR